MSSSAVQSPQYRTSGGKQYVFDPVTGKWVLVGGAGQPVAGNVRSGEPSTSIVPEETPLPPPATTPVVPSVSPEAPVGETPLPPPATTPVVPQAQAPGQSSSLLSGLNFDEELKKLLGADPRATELENMQYESIKRDLNASDFGPEDQNILDLAKQDAQLAYAQGTRTAEKEASAMGLRDSSYVVREFEKESSKMATAILQGSIAVRSRALERNTEKRVGAQGRARDFAQALQTKNVALAQALLQAHQGDAEIDLSRDQLDLQRRVVEENILMGRDRFTEEVRAQMKAEGFTEAQINKAEEQALWERSYRERQQGADIGLAQQNYQLQNRQVSIAELRNAADISLADRALAVQRELGLSAVNIDQQKVDQMKQQLENEFNIAISGQELTRQIQAGQLDLAKLVQSQTFTLEERRQQMNEVRNNADISLADRTFQLQQTLGLRAADLEGEKFKAYVKQLEREFGVTLNEFALKRQIQTGQLDLDVLNSQRKYDLDVESERQKWLATEAARQTQEKLGMSEIEMKLVISGGELSLARDAQVLQKFIFEAGLKEQARMFDLGLAWDKVRFETEMKEARKQRKSDFWGGIIKSVVKLGGDILSSGKDAAKAASTGGMG